MKPEWSEMVSSDKFVLMVARTFSGHQTPNGLGMSLKFGACTYRAFNQSIRQLPEWRLLTVDGDEQTPWHVVVNLVNYRLRRKTKPKNETSRALRMARLSFLCNWHRGEALYKRIISAILVQKFLNLSPEAGTGLTATSATSARLVTEMAYGACAEQTAGRTCFCEYHRASFMLSAASGACRLCFDKWRQLLSLKV